MRAVAVALALLAFEGACTDPQASRKATPTSEAAAHAVAGIGSSSLFGMGSATAAFLTVAVDSRGSPWWARNEGAPGAGSAECLERWRSLVRARDFGWLVLMCGLNDLRGGAPAQLAWVNLQTLLDEALADGLRVVPMTLQPFKGDLAWSADRQAQLLALNGSILQYCAAKRLRCVDVYAVLNDPGNDGAQQPRYDSGDHLHFNQAGHDVIGGLLGAALR